MFDRAYAYRNFMFLKARAATEAQAAKGAADKKAEKAGVTGGAAPSAFGEAEFIIEKDYSLPTAAGGINSTAPKASHK